MRSPKIRPKSGMYKAPLTITIELEGPRTRDATIHYTTDGTLPTPRSPVYKDPIVIKTDATPTIAAVAVRKKRVSPISANAYIVRADGPAPDPRPEPTPDPTPDPRPDPTPVPEDVNFLVDGTLGLQPISNRIYGTNLYHEPGHVMSKHPAFSRYGRLGGNLYTAYNWKNNAANAGRDWNHSNHGGLGGGEVPAEAVRMRLKEILANSANKALVTIPIGDYLAADKINGDVNQSPDYLNTRFIRNSSSLQGEFIRMLENEFRGRVDFCLDNEPDLWHDTHPRIFQKATFANLLARSKEYATMIKGNTSGSKVFGPVLSGYYGMMGWGAADAGNQNFVELYLQEMKKLSDAAGERILDVLDVHWYPEHRAGGQRVIFENGNEDRHTPELIKGRMDAPRSLADLDWKEDSWIANDVLKGPVKIISRLRAAINAFYAGTKLAFTEYYFGGGDHISGGIAQADVLGIFGREGVYAANLWHLGKSDDRFIYGAFKMYEKFGDQSLDALTSDKENTSVYASTNANGTRFVMMLNKSATKKRARITFKESGNLYKAAETWFIREGVHEPAKGESFETATPNSFVMELPPMSVVCLRSVKA